MSERAAALIELLLLSRTVIYIIYAIFNLK
jgi:hypothetical protein